MGAGGLVAPQGLAKGPAKGNTRICPRTRPVGLEREEHAIVGF